MPCDFRLEVFITLCRTGSFTRTADALGISQPAVSQNIAELEKDLGVRLFIRNRGEVTMTSDGILFRNYAERIVYWYESARSAFRTGKDTPGPIAVYCTADLSPVILPELFSALRRSYPGLAFISMSGVPDLQSGGEGEENFLYLHSYVSRAVQSGPESHDGDMLLADSSPVVAVSPLSRYLRDSMSPGFSYDYGSCPQLAVLAPAGSVLAAAGLSGKIVFTSDSAEAVKHLAVIDPDVAAVLPSYCAREELAGGRLSQLPSSWLDLRYSVSLRVSGSLRQLPVTEDIVRILRESLSAGRPLAL